MNVCIPSCEMCYTFRSMSLSLARSVRLVSLVAFSLVLGHYFAFLLWASLAGVRMG